MHECKTQTHKHTQVDGQTYLREMEEVDGRVRCREQIQTQSEKARETEGINQISKQGLKPRPQYILYV